MVVKVDSEARHGAYSILQLGTGREGGSLRLRIRIRKETCQIFLSRSQDYSNLISSNSFGKN